MKIYNKVIGLALAALTFTACTDTWDDHYEGSAEGINEGTLWEAMKQEPSLSNFVSVLEAADYSKQLYKAKWTNKYTDIFRKLAEVAEQEKTKDN